MMSPGPPPPPPPPPLPPPPASIYPRNTLPLPSSASPNSPMAESPRPMLSTAFPPYPHPHQLPLPLHPHQLPLSLHPRHAPRPQLHSTAASAHVFPGGILPPPAGLGHRCHSNPSNAGAANSNHPTNSSSSGGSTLQHQQRQRQQQQQQQQPNHLFTQQQQPHVRQHSLTPPHLPRNHHQQQQRADGRSTPQYGRILPSQSSPFAPPPPPLPPQHPQQSAYTYSPTSSYDSTGYDHPRYSREPDDHRRSSLSTMAPSPPTYSRGGRRTSSSEENYQQERQTPPGGALAAYSGGYPPPVLQPPLPLHTPTAPATSTALHDDGAGSRCDSPLQRTQGGRYRIRVRQQPVAARACGFGERDRRVIDPPPIVQLIVNDSDPMEIRYPFNVVHCTLWSEDGTTDETALTNSDKRVTRRLMGTLVSSPFVGLDEERKEGCFFCFPDLSCRTHGKYRLLFVLMRLEPSDLQPDGYTPIITQCMSDVFTVYTAKEFPGMRPSTQLTKALKAQGCAISVKKGNDKTQGGGGGGQAGGSGKDDESGDDDTPSSGTAKKQKTS